MSRQIVLDTETTGLEPSEGHRIIEIGCVEMVDRLLTGNTYHVYINPMREVEPGAIEVHGITNEFLSDKPQFAQIYEEFYAFIKGAELIIHNAPFDCGFIDHEFRLLNGKHKSVWDFCSIVDTLKLAREMHPGQRNNLDALCKRYDITSFQRDYHGALLDSEILAQVYLRMTGGQDSLFVEDGGNKAAGSLKSQTQSVRLDLKRPDGELPVITASDAELAAHREYLEFLRGKCEDPVEEW